MTHVMAATIGLLLGGPVGALAVAATHWLWRRLNAPKPVAPPVTLVLMLLLIELRAGVSVLAALIATSEALPEHSGLRTVARVARVSGLTQALQVADDELRPVIAQLARAQRSGASLAGTVRTLLDNAIGSDRARRLARARTLPTRLMIPVTLLMLPGLVLAVYAPSLLATFEDLTGGLT